MGTRGKGGVTVRGGRRASASPGLLDPLEALGFLALGIESGLRWVSKSMSCRVERVADSLAEKRMEARMNCARALLRAEAVRQRSARASAAAGGVGTP